MKATGLCILVLAIIAAIWVGDMIREAMRENRRRGDALRRAQRFRIAREAEDRRAEGSPWD